MPASAGADLAQCRALLRSGSRTFYAASFLLPRRVRDPATALYAFCRLADDAVDMVEAPEEGIAQITERLDLAYRGDPLACAADRAFARAVYAFDVPRALPEALIEGFAWDAEGRRYETVSDLTGYAARVAGTVGAMMAVLMGAREEQVLARACDLGVAMQLTNICRDVGEDARNGRLYLPLAWMREAGIDPDEWVGAPRFTPDLATVVARVLGFADELYARSAIGDASLPADCRPGIHAARLLYSEIGREVQRCGLDSVSRRAVVPAKRKLQLLVRAVTESSARPHLTSEFILDEVEFLVRAAARTGRSGPDGLAAPLRTHPAWWDLHGRWVRVLEIFERLERAEQEYLASLGNNLSKPEAARMPSGGAT